MALDINACTGQIVDAAIKVHTALGPGLLESAYEVCLTHELRLRGLQVLTQHPVSIGYDGVRIDVGYRIDMLVQGMVIIELKAQRQLLPVHDAQLLSYLKLSGHKVGLMINFHEMHLKDGIRRMVNGL